MNPYLQVVKNTWDEAVMYRLSFILFRLQSVFSLLTVYFLWMAAIPPGQALFGYTQTRILTYIFLTNLVDSMVMSSRTNAIATDITMGNLTNYLIRPFSYLKYYFARDISDKAMNVLFASVEVTLLYLLLRPPVYLQTNPVLLLLFPVTLVMGLVLYFFISVLLGFIGFWSNETWGPRFVFWQMVGFFSGALFPLDILPTFLYQMLQYLPFSYLLYFPIKVYLGDLSVQQVILGLAIALSWILIMYTIVIIVWHKGLRSYTAQGR